MAGVTAHGTDPGGPAARPAPVQPRGGGAARRAGGGRGGAGHRLRAAGHGQLPDRPPGTDPQETTVLFDLSTGLAVAAFLGLSALAHLIVSTVRWRGYVADLSRGINRARWVEYSLSSSLMMVVTAQLVGIADVTALLVIVGANASMILFGWLQERYEDPGGGGWLPFWFVCIAGSVPWIALVIYTLAPQSPADVSPPGFVYAIVVSLFVFFNVFAPNQVLQYRAKDRWADYLFGENICVVLSLVAKSLLAWQVFGGTLAG